MSENTKGVKPAITSQVIEKSSLVLAAIEPECFVCGRKGHIKDKCGLSEELGLLLRATDTLGEVIEYSRHAQSSPESALYRACLTAAATDVYKTVLALSDLNHRTQQDVWDHGCHPDKYFSGLKAHNVAETMMGMAAEIAKRFAAEEYSSAMRAVKEKSDR